MPTLKDKALDIMAAEKSALESVLSVGQELIAECNSALGTLELPNGFSSDARNMIMGLCSQISMRINLEIPALLQVLNQTLSPPENPSLPENPPLPE